jgi:hypothetical protein
MSFHVPYHETVFVPGDDVFPGNSTAEDPVTFAIAPAAGPYRARLRSILFATSTIGDDGVGWSREVSEAVIVAYGRGGQLFANTVDAVTGLTVPGKLAKRAGIIPTDRHHEVDDAAKIPIKSGVDFGLVSGFLIKISFLVAMEIAKISRELDQTDARLFESPSGSPSPATPSPTPGTAARVRRGHGRRGTAA